MSATVDTESVLEGAALPGWVGDKQQEQRSGYLWLQVFCAPAGKQIANSKEQSCLGEAEISVLGNSETSPHRLSRRWSEYCQH